ncbi:MULTISPECIES: NAD(P)/FAD-dependent oxidoreductase [Nguyenibacter]|uniref:NAD(P)/FAD-dependent oxidoreductase n=1 Tax=Nguyenibacter vanlangensis TaxID=1216886 RepID=A0A7Y7IWJ2_9PROT|nr:MULTISPECIES: NAD(P)/FAD-dependent oxidoreductase [Nguyenibacter]NVN11675.1 NAD(P)/FAD-dependent oxidoreductase [Nguyenibacter vanlangensis]WRH88538.1 NAD(P)/FAD-dependent oxidoreductase [Nguyenibacter sp. L1]
MSDRFRFVIVGGGIAGMEMATYLGNTLGRSGQAEVTLIDSSFFHVWKPMLHEFAAGTSPNDRNRVSFLAQASRKSFKYWPGVLDGVDRAARQVELAPMEDERGNVLLDRRSLSYDALIVSIGSRANDFGLPGITEHCHFIDNLTEADAFNTRFRSLVLQAIGQSGTLQIAIVGGGATGVELAAELHRALDLAANYGAGMNRADLHVTLLEAGPRILPAFPEAVSEDSRRQLEALGITVHTSAQVTGADADGFLLGDGTRIDARLKVWAAGVKAPAATTLFEGLERSRSGQLVVRPTLQTTRDDRIFALGDCSFIAEKPVPATAQAARQQARHLSRQMKGWIGGGAIAPFHYRDRGAVVSLGDYNGWGTLGKYHFGGGPLRGLPARLGHDMLYRQHQMEIHGPARALAAWGADQLDEFVRPIVRLD